MTMITFLLGVAVGFIIALFNFIFLMFYWKKEKKEQEKEIWYMCIDNYGGFVKGRMYKADRHGKIYTEDGVGVCPGEALARLADSNEIETWKQINHIK